MARAGRKLAPPKLGVRSSAFHARQEVKRLELVGIFIIQSIYDRPVLYGNEPLERVLVGMSSNPANAKSQAKQWGTDGFDKRMWVWWVQGKKSAEALYRRIAIGLDPFDDDPALGRCYSQSLENAKLQIEITAALAGIEIFDDAGAKRLREEARRSVIVPKKKRVVRR